MIVVAAPELSPLLDQLRAKGVDVREREADSTSDVLALLEGAGVVTVLRPREAAPRPGSNAQAFLDAVVESVPVMIFVKDAETLSFQLVNQACEEIIGLKREQLLGKTDADFFPREQAEFFNAQDRKVLQERRPVDIPAEPIETASGRRWLHTRKVPILGRGGEPRYLLGVSMDVTARKEAEEALVKARDLAEAANRAKSGFLANMSHELRTPLNAVIGFSELLEEGLPPDASPELREFAGHIKLSGKHLLVLINDLLDLANVEAGRERLNVKPVDLPAQIAAAVRAFAGFVADKGLLMAVDIPAPIAPVLADARKVRQILDNLLSNALKFTPAGGQVRVHAAVVDEGREQHIEVSVSDTGIGIRPEDVARIFDSFEQVESSYARTHAGAGLGLALTRKLVELHGGRIRVVSEPGKGSTFSFTVPVRRT